MLYLLKQRNKEKIMLFKESKNKTTQKEHQKYMKLFEEAAKWDLSFLFRCKHSGL